MVSEMLCILIVLMTASRSYNVAVSQDVITGGNGDKDMGFLPVIS